MAVHSLGLAGLLVDVCSVFLVSPEPTADSLIAPLNVTDATQQVFQRKQLRAVLPEQTTDSASITDACAVCISVFAPLRYVVRV